MISTIPYFLLLLVIILLAFKLYSLEKELKRIQSIKIDQTILLKNDATDRLVVEIQRMNNILLYKNTGVKLNEDIKHKQINSKLGLIEQHLFSISQALEKI